MSKYNSRKVERDGMVFDSVKEYRRYTELSLLEKAGEISDLQRQVKFRLIPPQYEQVDGKSRCVERACDYVADFVYINKDGQKVVEDTKGYKTKDYIIKRKLMLMFHGIRIREI